MNPDREKIENLTKDEEEIIILIAGTINATGKTLYWKSDRVVSVGDYAIVENMNGYDLIKVVGIIDTTKENASKFSNTKYNNMKRVIQGMQKELIEK